MSAHVGVNQATKVGKTPLLMGSYKGHGTVVEQLLAAGADASELANRGYSLPKLARNRGHSRVVEALTSAADTHARPTSGARTGAVRDSAEL